MKEKEKIKYTFRLIEECNDIIEEYDLEREARLSADILEKMQGKEASQLDNLYIISKLKKELTRERKKKINIGMYKVYCALKGIEFNESEMMDSDAGEVETLYDNFQNKIK